MQIFNTIPILAVLPIMIVWFGIDELPKVLIIAFGAFVPMYLNLFSAIRGVDQRLIEMARTTRRGHLAAGHPGAGARRAARDSWSGCGSRSPTASSGWSRPRRSTPTRASASSITQGQTYLQTNQVFVGLVIYSILGLLADQLVRILERVLLRWRPELRGGMSTAVATPPRQRAGAVVEQVVRRFGDRVVLDHLDLAIDDEELVVLLGPSGCGKSTLLRLLAGLDRPDGGTVEVPAQRAIVFQGDRLLPWQRVLRNVTLGLRGAGRRASAPAPRSPRSASPAASGPGPRNCPAARPSGWPWPGRWSPSPSWCCSTSRSRRWTRSPGCACTTWCARCAASTTPRCCSSRTTSTRRSRWPTASSS